MSNEFSEFMESGVNLYDQVPFRDPIQTISQESGILIETIRVIVPAVSEFQAHHQVGILTEEEKQTILANSKKEILRSVSAIGLRTGKQGYQKFIPIFERLALSIQDVPLSTELLGQDAIPHWVSYLRYSVKSGSHRSNEYSGTGERNKTNRGKIGTYTYLGWVMEQARSIEADKRAILFGIEEIFDPEIQKQAFLSGRRQSNRRWRILKAADLIQ
jgi:hypothetical protein